MWFFTFGGSLFMAAGVYDGMDRLNGRHIRMEKNIRREVGKDMVGLLREMEEMKKRLESLENGDRK
jgi:hypothetical protein